MHRAPAIIANQPCDRRHDPISCELTAGVSFPPLPVPPLDRLRVGQLAVLVGQDLRCPVDVEVRDHGSPAESVLPHS